MRLEARYAGPKADAEAIRRLAGPGANCLTYGVTNHYLDVEGGGFARAEMGSPRLRLRLYEGGGYLFGSLEHKRQVTPERTEKRVWPAEEAWGLLTAAMPWLAGVDLRRPPTGDELSSLVPSFVEDAPAFGSLRHVCSLRYRRVSCLGSELRVTADFDFEPAVVADDEMIVETKGERRLAMPALAQLGLRPLTASKFGLLSGVAA